mmetsp:Transcript_86975/g.243819  ORF Transcript_86975/g.243819 Transcript_86975/m.243819 type:complete len:210 (+) Transcript_86975:2183-2812(+)
MWKRGLSPTSGASVGSAGPASAQPCGTEERRTGEWAGLVARQRRVRKWRRVAAGKAVLQAPLEIRILLAQGTVRFGELPLRLLHCGKFLLQHPRNLGLHGRLQPRFGLETSFQLPFLLDQMGAPRSKVHDSLRELAVRCGQILNLFGLCQRLRNGQAGLRARGPRTRLGRRQTSGRALRFRCRGLLRIPPGLRPLGTVHGHAMPAALQP